MRATTRAPARNSASSRAPTASDWTTARLSVLPSRVRARPRCSGPDTKAPMAQTHASAKVAT